MSDLDALRARGWEVWGPELVEALDDDEQALWYLHALHGTPTDAVVRVEHRDRTTAEARLLAACGLPTERERVLEEALRYIAGEYGIDLAALPFEITLTRGRRVLRWATPTKEPPDA